VRLREVIPVGVWVARTSEQEALRPVQGEGKQRRLHRTASISVPPPFRLYALVVTNVLTLIVLPSWVSFADGDVAVVSHVPLKGRGHYGWRVRLLVLYVALLAALAALGLGAIALGQRWPRAVIVGASLAAALVVAATIPLVWPVKAFRERRTTASLRERRAALLRETRGPVHAAYGLGSSNHTDARRALLARLRDQADAAGITVVARAEEALAGLYARNGFTEEARATTSWGTEVLLVRRPGAKPVRGWRPPERSG